jgi:hypothetical protein
MNEPVNQPFNPRLKKLDAIHQAFAPRRKEPGQEKKRKLHKGVQKNMGWEGESILDTHNSNDTGQ